MELVTAILSQISDTMSAFMGNRPRLKVQDLYLNQFLHNDKNNKHLFPGQKEERGNWVEPCDQICAQISQRRDQISIVITKT